MTKTVIRSNLMRQAPSFLDGTILASVASPLLLLLLACQSAPDVKLIEGPRIAAKQSADPALAVDAATGDLLMTWVEGDSGGYRLMFARSTNEGVAWSEPVAVTASTDEIKPHAEASPRVVAARGVIGVFWPKQQHVPGRRFPASQMRFARSQDGGRTWSTPITLNDDTTSAPVGHTFHGATVVGDSSFIVAWLDSREIVEESHGEDTQHHEGSSYVFTARSNDLGTTWESRNQKYWANACPCCRVSLAPAGNDIIAAWRGHFEGDVRDIVTAPLTSNAQPQRAHADNWVFPGCPHSGPGLTVENNEVHLTWFTGAPDRMGVYYAQRGHEPVRVIGGAALPTAHPVVAVFDDKVIVAANVNAAGERALTVAEVNGSKVNLLDVPETDGADHPQLLRVGDRALLAWTQNGHVRLARVTID